MTMPAVPVMRRESSARGSEGRGSLVRTTTLKPARVVGVVGSRGTPVRSLGSTAGRGNDLRAFEGPGTSSG